MENIKKLSGRRWERILGSANTPETPPQDITVSLHKNRRVLYRLGGSSPAKETDDE
jgi:hypothetical protein